MDRQWRPQSTIRRRSRDAAGDVIRHIFGVLPVARREVRIHRNIVRSRNVGDERRVSVAGECDFGIRQPLRERKARAGRRQCGESEMLQVPCGASAGSDSRSGRVS
jgi:hypothetical protein